MIGAGANAGARCEHRARPAGARPPERQPRDRQQERHHAPRRDVTEAPDAEQDAQRERGADPARVEIIRQQPDPRRRKRQHQRVVQRLAAQDEMRGRERDADRRGQRARHAETHAPRRQVDQPGCEQAADQRRGQPHRRLAERANLQRRRDQIEQHRVIPGIAPRHLHGIAKRIGEIEKQREAIAVDVAAGLRDRVAADRKVRLVAAEVDRRAVQSVDVKRRADGEDEE